MNPVASCFQILLLYFFCIIVKVSEVQLKIRYVERRYTSSFLYQAFQRLGGETEALINTRAPPLLSPLSSEGNGEGKRRIKE